MDVGYCLLLVISLFMRPVSLRDTKYTIPNFVPSLTGAHPKNPPASVIRCSKSLFEALSAISDTASDSSGGRLGIS